MSKQAYLILENGQIFEGKSFGYEGETCGEVVFTTAMTGYNETITDPSYCGQIVIQTFPLIGNYGVIEPDFESKKPYLQGYIVREWCHAPSNFRCEGDIDTFLKSHKIVGLYGIDTRQLTKIIRESGTMNGKIVTSLDTKNAALAEAKQYSVKNTVEQVSIQETEEFLPDGKPEYHVVLIDFGEKFNIRRELVKRGCKVTVVPYNTSCEQIQNLKPDGVMLSNGPGDPSDNTAIIAELSKLSKTGIPIFGICLGHQLLALSQGAKTEKLKYGHRGANQPALELQTGKVYITSQNHGYAVVNDSLPGNAVVSFTNVNDKTCEGINYLNFPAFSVQFHPEACGGPLDTNFLFDKFTALMKEAQ